MNPTLNELAARLKMDDRFVRSLPGDASVANHPRAVLGALYSPVAPTRVASPQLVSKTPEVAQLLGLDSVPDGALAEIMSGNRLLDGMRPYAQCYGGHQFGHWAGQLGDGRAITLGEIIGTDGQHYDVQLKGAGPTPYSRRGDGRAVLRSSVREFLCSEAMHHLGVPTTRALSLTLTGDSILRDMFYDGNAAMEPGAVVCRVAPSFLRFGTYQLPASRGDEETLRALVDFTIENHFPDLGTPGPDAYLAWLREVCRSTAQMVVEWMRVGFVHGVMNTDNMSVHGLTIDYGPYGWLEGFDPGWTPNTTDEQGRRYRFGAQPAVAFWNLVRFAESLHPLIGESAPLEAALETYPEELEARQTAMIAAKLGLPEMSGERDELLVEELFRVLTLAETDMTLFYRGLAGLPYADSEVDSSALLGAIVNAYYDADSLRPAQRRPMVEWLRAYASRVRNSGVDEADRSARMNATNPLYVLRNYLAQEAIDLAEEGDFSRVNELARVLRNPYDEQESLAHFAQKRPEWARHRAGCSMLSCSS